MAATRASGTNAVRYGTRAEVSVEILDRSIRITVEDDGPGIPSGEWARVREPFRAAAGDVDGVADQCGAEAVALDELLPRADGPESRLTEAMRYAALGPGKRLRPFFAIEASRLFEIEERPVLRAACALECVHAYSLVHDDLPCMDDDDMRRGKPTVHKAYDEACAILAGDGLQSLAFEAMAVSLL